VGCDIPQCIDILTDSTETVREFFPKIFPVYTSTSAGDDILFIFKSIAGFITNRPICIDRCWECIFKHKIILSTNANIWGPNKPQREILSNEAFAELKEACRSKGGSDCCCPPPLFSDDKKYFQTGMMTLLPSNETFAALLDHFHPGGRGGGPDALNSIQYSIQQPVPIWFTKHTRGCKVFIPSHTGSILFGKGCVWCFFCTSPSPRDGHSYGVLCFSNLPR